MIIDSQILSDRARAEAAAKIATGFDGMNPEYVSLVEGQLPGDYVEDSGSPIGAYLTSDGLLQKVSWNFTTEVWDNFGPPTPTKEYVDTKASLDDPRFDSLAEDKADKDDSRFLSEVEKAVAMADRWKVKVTDPEEWVTAQEGFGGIGEFPDETIGMLVPVGDKHNLTERHLYFIRSQDRYGYNWQEPVLVDSVAGMDIRNGCVGCGENGDFIGIFAHRQTNGTNINAVLYYSQDGGENWITTPLLENETGISSIHGHGNIIELSTKYLATTYGGGTVHIIEISKDFSSVSVIKSYDINDLADGLDPEDYSISEPCIVKAGPNLILGIIRNNTQYGNIMQFYSDDGGNSWSDIYQTGIQAGQVPPMLYADETMVYVTFPARGGMSQDNMGWNYLISYKPITKLTEISSRWQWSLALFPISNLGDRERSHLFKRNGQFFLIWKMGTPGDSGDGESVQWIKNIGRFT